jgi:hypothetical protein
MKDGRTHLAHKVEHAVDLEAGAIVAVTLQPADRGDTQSLEETLNEALAALEDEEAEQQMDTGVRKTGCRQGYHSNEVVEPTTRINKRF